MPDKWQYTCMSISPFLHLHHNRQYDFVVNLYLNFPFFNNNKVSDDDANSGRQKSSYSSQSKRFVTPSKTH